MMAIIKSCCFGTKTLRSGSFASGIYTLTSYTIFVTIGAFHINLVIHVPVLFILSLLLLLFSGLCVMTSIVLLVGLCVDNRNMLIPWMLNVSITTTLDIIFCFFVINDKETIFDTVVWFLFFSDIFICILNFYCVVCVYSQYQEYLEGRGGPEGDQRRRNENDFILLSPKLIFGPKNKQNTQKTNEDINDCNRSVTQHTVNIVTNGFAEDNNSLNNLSNNGRQNPLIRIEIHSNTYPIIQRNFNVIQNNNNNVIKTDINPPERDFYKNMFYSTI